MYDELELMLTTNVNITSPYWITTDDYGLHNMSYFSVDNPHC